MSENEVDNNEKEIIEVDVNQEPLDESYEKGEKVETVVVKKGSFLSFLAFVFSIAALGLSGYLFYLQQDKATTNNNNWQQPLDKVDSKITDIKTQLKTEEESLQQLSTKVEELNNKTSILQTTLKTTQINQQQSNTSVQAPEQKSENYDDSQLKKQIAALENKMSEATQLNATMQEDLTARAKQAQQTIQQLQKDIKAKEAGVVTTGQLPSTIDQAANRAQVLLQEAYIQLNIKENREKALDLLGKTQDQLLQLTTPTYSSLAKELKNITNEIANMPALDTSKINKEIKQLSLTTDKLTFAQGEKHKQKQDAAWYEKLVVIKKVDNTEQKRQSMSEQLGIKSAFKNHYKMLEIALMAQNQNLWTGEISAIEALLNQHFAKKSKPITVQLSQLKKIDLNPKFPDLEHYLNALKNIDVSVGG